MPNGLDGKGWRSLETLSHLLYVSRCKAAELISNPIEKMRCFMRTSTHTHGSIANLTEAYFWLKFGFLKANPSRRHASFQATGPTGRHYQGDKETFLLSETLRKEAAQE